MPTYQTVVIGVHDSPTGRRAVELAAPLSSETGAKIVLVTAYGSRHRRPHEHEPYREPGDSAARLALKHAEEICLDHGVAEVESHAVAGDPVEVLTGAVREHRADLLLVGSHGLSSLGGRLLGSVPGGVTREAVCDVLVVHTTHTAAERWRELVHRLRFRRSRYQRTVLVGVHDSPRSMRAVDRAAGIAADFDAELVIAGAYELPGYTELKRATDVLGDESHLVRGSFAIDAVLRDAEARARRRGATKVEQVVIKGDAMKGLLKVSDLRAADILVMGNHALTGRMSQLIGSISEQVSRRTATHVLLVH